jgi:hypothetical protein
MPSFLYQNQQDGRQHKKPRKNDRQFRQAREALPLTGVCLGASAECAAKSPLLAMLQQHDCRQYYAQNNVDQGQKRFHLIKFLLIQTRLC